jgi:hypothetical protein
MRPVQNKKKRLDLDNIQYIEINLFDHDIKGQVHIVDIPLFDTLAILDLQTKTFAHRIHVLPWTIKTLAVLTMVFTFALD